MQPTSTSHVASTQMNHPPPPVLIHRDIGDIEHPGQIQTSQGDQIECQHPSDPRPMAATEGGGHIVKEDKHHHHDPDIRPTGSFDIFPSLIDEPAAEIVAGTALHQQIDRHHHSHRGGQDPEAEITQFKPRDFPTAFLFQEPIHRADESIQHPHDHGIDVYHAVDIEIENPIEKVGVQVLDPSQHTENQLGEKQNHGDTEILDRQFLSVVEICTVQGSGHVIAPRYCQSCKENHWYRWQTSISEMRSYLRPRIL